MKKLFVCVFILTSVILSSFFNLTCATSSDIKFYMSSNSESVYRNSEINILVSVEALKSINVSTFKLTIYFDEQELSFKDVSACNALNDSELKYNINGPKLDIIFLTDFEGLNIDENQKVNLLEIDFKVKSKTCNHETVLKSEVDGVGNYNENYLSALQPNDVSVEILDDPKFDCRLISLKPLDASLTPDFDPDVYEYEVDVPYDFKEIEFDYVPIENNAEVKVNRRTLKKAGEETKIKITVQSPDKKNRLTYIVNVKRDVKDENKKSSSDKSERSKSQKKNTDVSKKELKDVNQSEIVNNNDENNDLKTLTVRKNGFSFIVFSAVIVVFVSILFFVWFKKHNNCK